jgi:hypothetical protein
VLLPRKGAAAATALWIAGFAYQCVRLGSILAMGEEGLLFDLLYLGSHAVIFGTDLVGWLAVPAVLAAAVGLAGAAWTVHTLFDLVRTELSSPAGRQVLAALWVAAGVGTALRLPVTWITPVLAANLGDSVAVWGEAADLVAEASAPAPGPIPADGPDVHVYVVESYGSLLFRDPALSEAFVPHLREVSRTLEAHGWSAVSAFSRSPVSGGRSWIADASVLLGVPVAHESAYQHLMARVDRLNHLPGWLREQGWHTVLCRPKDRARPGVALENPLGFDTTVFYADLAYAGPPFGWGWIPDQYTLGWLRDEVLPKTASRPTFLFVHLATAHVPWKQPPPVLEDWRGLATLPWEASHPDDRDLDDELGFTANRFRRGPKGLGPTLRRYMGIGDPTAAYRQVVTYDVDQLRDHLVAMAPTRPTVVVVLGDHQPPGISRRNDFTVPVHVFATERALLAPLSQWGFEDGVALGPDTPPTLGHHDLYEALAAVLQRGPDP